MSSGSGPYSFGADNQQVYLFGSSWSCRELVQASCLQHQGAGVFLCVLPGVCRGCGRQGTGGRCDEARGAGAAIGGRQGKDGLYDVGASGREREGDRSPSGPERKDGGESSVQDQDQGQDGAEKGIVKRNSNNTII